MYASDIAPAWIPRIIVRRRSEKAPLASTFVAVIEPFTNESKIASIRRLPLHAGDDAPCSDANLTVEIQFVDGSRDLLIAADVENPLGLEPGGAGQEDVLVQPDWKTTLAGELCVVRKDMMGKNEGEHSRCLPGANHRGTRTYPPRTGEIQCESPASWS